MPADVAQQGVGASQVTGKLAGERRRHHDSRHLVFFLPPAIPALDDLSRQHEQLAGGWQVVIHHVYADGHMPLPAHDARGHIGREGFAERGRHVVIFYQQEVVADAQPGRCHFVQPLPPFVVSSGLLHTDVFGRTKLKVKQKKSRFSPIKKRKSGYNRVLLGEKRTGGISTFAA